MTDHSLFDGELRLSSMEKLHRYEVHNSADSIYDKNETEMPFQIQITQ